MKESTLVINPSALQYVTSNSESQYNGKSIKEFTLVMKREEKMPERGFTVQGLAGESHGPAL